MKPKVGQYYYTIYHSMYRIYRYDVVCPAGSISSLVTDEPIFSNPEEARKRVYELNGWKYTPRHEQSNT